MKYILSILLIQYVLYVYVYVYEKKNVDEGLFNSMMIH